MLHNGEEDSRSKRRRRSCVQVATSSDEYLSSFIATSSSAASSPIACKSPGMPMASGKPDSRMSIEPSSFDAASTSQLKCDSRMHTLAGWWKSSGETRRIKKKKKIQKTPKIPTILRLEPGTTKRNLLAKTPKLRGNTLHTEPVLQLSRKVKREYGSDVEPLSPHIAGHIALYGSRVLHGQVDLWKTTWRSHGRFKCEFGYLANVHEYHSSSSSSSRKRLWHVFTLREEPYLGLSGTIIWWNKKNDFWNSQKSLVQKHQRSLVWK